MNDKMWVGWSIGNSAVSKAIQRHSKDELRLFKNIPELVRPDKESELATHVFAINKGIVYESHFCVDKDGLERRGVMEWTYNNWLKYSNRGNKFYYFEYPYLSLEKLEYYVKNNPGYGRKNIAQLLARDLMNHFLSRPLANSKDMDKGLICSEYLAECDNGQILLLDCNASKPHLIKPVHWQAWAYNNCPDKIIKGEI